MTDFTIRPAKPGDEDTIVALLRALAQYEKLTHRFHITPEIVRRDYLSERPLVFCDLLFQGDVAAGIANWYWTYGSFAAARKIYLADLFVDPEFRGRHYGRALIANLARRVLAHDGIGIDWEVLDWNQPSIDFYDGLGATSIKNWIAYNLGGEALKKAAET
ncbi:MAG: GNAT family N-acetyltransferase [Alphaproteobacteria bacterium]|nr:GNAT family N-acetyltransferase [Alphaproteobacteria bacterium]